MLAASIFTNYQYIFSRFTFTNRRVKSSSTPFSSFEATRRKKISKHGCSRKEHKLDAQGLCKKN